jgi:hypothetical protein
MAAGWGGKAMMAGAALCMLPTAGLAQTAAPVSTQAQAQESLEMRVARQPAAVRAFIKRRLECNHWGGEEPYSKARARQIARAVQRMGCDHLDRDEVQLRKRYSANAELPALLDTVKDAWEL